MTVEWKTVGYWTLFEVDYGFDAGDEIRARIYLLSTDEHIEEDVLSERPDPRFQWINWRPVKEVAYTPYTKVKHGERPTEGVREAGEREAQALGLIGWQ